MTETETKAEAPKLKFVNSSNGVKVEIVLEYHGLTDVQRTFVATALDELGTHVAHLLRNVTPPSPDAVPAGVALPPRQTCKLVQKYSRGGRSISVNMTVTAAPLPEELECTLGAKIAHLAHALDDMPEQHKSPSDDSLSGLLKTLGVRSLPIADLITTLSEHAAGLGKGRGEDTLGAALRDVLYSRFGSRSDDSDKPDDLGKRRASGW